MKYALFVATVLLSSFFAAPADALTGNLTGCVKFTDTREQGSPSVNSFRANGGGVVKGIKHARIRLYNQWGSQTGTGITDNSGCFAIYWDDWTAFGYGLDWHIQVELQSPSQFYVATEAGFLFKYKRDKRINDDNESMGTISLTGDAPLVYATAQEFWDRIVRDSAVGNIMTNVRIDAETSLDISHASNRNWVRLVNTRGRFKPVQTVAHEIGHALTMHSIDRDFLIGLPCSPNHNFDEPMNCEGPPFHEAMANVFATAYQWKEHAPDSEVTMGGFTVGQASSACVGLFNQHRIEMCIGGAIWDIYDHPPSDDDGLSANGSYDPDNVSKYDLVDILIQYDNSSANRGKDEGGENGNNLWDWLENFDDLFHSLLNEALDIYDAHRLTSGEEPFPS